MTQVSIKVTGLSEAMKALKEIDAQIPRDLKKGFKEDAQVILQQAKGYASSLGGVGTYAGSLSIRSAGEGVRIQSSDEAAGVKEFAHRGAMALKGIRKGKPVGVPMGEPARALVRAANENEDYVALKVERRLQDAIDRYLNG